MFFRSINLRVLSLSQGIIKSTAALSLSSKNQYRSKNFKTVCRAAPNVTNSLCRLYSIDAKLDEMVVDFEEVQKATTNDKILIVDVREPEEVKEHGKIPSSVNIPLGTVSSVLSTMPDAEFERTFKRPKPNEDTQIIFYCMIGKRSGMAQQNAFNLGYKNVKNYLGSWTDWNNKMQI